MEINRAHFCYRDNNPFRRPVKEIRKNDMTSRHTNGPDLMVHYLPINKLTPNSQNARTHSKHQIRQIAKSIREFGFINQVLLDKANTIVAGHGRVAAARVL